MRARVWTLIDTLSTTGGAERLAAKITLALDRDQFEPAVVMTRPGPRAAAAALELTEAGIPVHTLARRRGKVSPLALLELVRLLRRERVDVLHAHKHGPNVWAAVAGRLAGVPVIVTHEHTWSWHGERLRVFLDRQVVARLTTVHLAVSREDQRRMTEVEKIDPRKTRFVPNGILSPRPASSGAAVRASLGIAADAPIVLTVSVLRAQKALDVLVAAADLLRKRVPSIQVLIAGGGDEEERLRQLIHERGLDGTVRLIGRRSDVPELLEAADVLVSTSDFEGSPLAVMEYMAAGKAIVATRVGGVPDLIADGVHGLLVEPRDPPAFANAVTSLLEDPARARSLGSAAKLRQREEFTLDAMVRTLSDLYCELLASARRRRAS